ncbi:c-type cytochrome [Undibacterium arcticum]
MDIALLLVRSAVAILIATAIAPAEAAGDPARGAHAFQACAACHSVEPGEHMTGPSLAHVWGRKAGTAEGFPRFFRRAQTLRGRLERSGPRRMAAQSSRLYPGQSDDVSGTPERPNAQRTDCLSQAHVRGQRRCSKRRDAGAAEP